MTTVFVSDATFAELYDALIERHSAVERMDQEREHLRYTLQNGATIVFGETALARAPRPEPAEFR